MDKKAPAHHGYEPADTPQKEPVNLWYLYDSDQIQDSACWWLPATWFHFYAQAEKLVVEFPGGINLIAKPYYVEVVLVGTCDDGKKARVVYRVYPEAFSQEERLALMKAVRRAHPQGTKDFLQLRAKVARALGVPNNA